MASFFIPLMVEEVLFRLSVKVGHISIPKKNDNGLFESDGYVRTVAALSLRDFLVKNEMTPQQ